jgi:hypothetical protein
MKTRYSKNTPESGPMGLLVLYPTSAVDDFDTKLLPPGSAHKSSSANGNTEEP